VHSGLPKQHGGYKKLQQLVFCFQNCFDLLLVKIVLVIDKNWWNLRLIYFQNYCDQYHTGISCQNFFHSTIIPPWRVSWVSREADKLKELQFVSLVLCFSVKMEWHSKNLQKLSKSSEKLLFLGIFSEFVQFWLENSSPNQLDKLKWIILLLLTPKPSLEVQK
jgi:hypothetical protein